MDYYNLSWDEKVKRNICPNCNSRNVKLCGIKEMCSDCVDTFKENRRIENIFRRYREDED